MSLKKLLTKLKELKEFQLKANRFIRNYGIFKSSLISKDKKEFPITNLILGNRESKFQITIITSPFCGYCKNAHKILEKILEKYYNDIQIRVIIKVDIERESDESKALFRTLMTIYLEKGEIAFRTALDNWFEYKDIKKWLTMNKLESSNIKNTDKIYNMLNIWCSNNDINYTPAIFINGYQFPDGYERENLIFFIDELLEDEF